MQPGNDADPGDEIVAAATRVFASEPTRQVTLKRVALEAHVPAQVVLDSWANITELLSAVLERIMQDLAEGFADDAPPRHGGELDDRQDALVDALMCIWVRAALDGYDIEPLVDEHPTIARMVGRLVDGGLDDVTARHRVFQQLILEFGYRLFGEQMATACGLEGEPLAQRRAGVNAVQVAIPRLPPVASAA
jgi:AcrR family transcriptional regulator